MFKNIFLAGTVGISNFKEELTDRGIPAETIVKESSPTNLVVYYFGNTEEALGGFFRYGLEYFKKR
jgi:hypothetical protein